MTIVRSINHLQEFEEEKFRIQSTEEEKAYCLGIDIGHMNAVNKIIDLLQKGKINDVIGITIIKHLFTNKPILRSLFQLKSN